MGQAKNEQIRFEEKVACALDMCVEVGAVDVCPVHDGEYMDNLSFLDMNELTEHILDNDPAALGQFKDKAEMVECVAAAMASAGDECGYCAKNRDS